MAQIKFFNLPISYNGQDRVLFNTEYEKFNDFNNTLQNQNETLQCSNYKRIDDLTFEIDIYGIDVHSFNYNYGIFYKEVKQSDNTTIHSAKYFLFVDSIIEKTETTAKGIFKLDTITQYFQVADISTTKESFVKRTHLNRWIKENDLYKPRFDDTHELNIKEDFDFQPSIIAEDGIKYDEDLSLSKRNVKWLAITLAKWTTSVKLPSEDNIKTHSEYIQMPTVKFYVPLAQQVRFFQESNYPNTIDFELHSFEIDDILEELADSVINVELLPYLAIKKNKTDGTTLSNYSFDYYINNEEDCIDFVYSTNILEAIITPNEANLHYPDGLFLPCSTNLHNGELMTLYTRTALNNHQWQMSTEQLKTIRIEPKTLQYGQYMLTFLNEAKPITMDLLQNDSVSLKLKRHPSVMNTSYDVYLESGLYNNEKSTGAFIFAQEDLTLPSSYSKWAEYVMNNKTSSQSAYAYGIPLVKGMMTTAVASTVNPMMAVVSASNTVAEMINIKNQRQDLQQAPDKLRSKGSNVFGYLGEADTFKICATVVDITAEQKKQITDFLHFNGYKLNQYRNIKTLIADNKRRAFNYLELEEDDNILNKGISQAIIDDINNRLKKGIRFYHSLTKLIDKSDLTNREIYIV